MFYVLGALPVSSKTEVSDYLRRFLRRTEGTYNLDVEWVYMDSQLFSQDAVNAIREIDTNFLIQAPDQNKGGIRDILDAADPGEPEPKEDIRFSDYSFNRRPNAFAWPIPPEEMGADAQGSHKPFITDLKVESDDVDLKKVGRRFRERWGVETSIREIKVRYHANCRHSDHRVRAFFFMMASLLYNLSQYVDNRLEERLLAEDVDWNSGEFLHAVRRIDPDDVPDWGDNFQAADDSEWTTIS